MGCASSREKRCRHCNAPYSSPVARSYSMPMAHPPQERADTYHLVALTSSTIGSFAVTNSPEVPVSVSVPVSPITLSDKMRNPSNQKSPTGEDNSNSNRKDEFLLGLVEAKTWSRMIEEKITKKPIPKTPLLTPPGEPETINTWEIMEGLEDWSPLNLSQKYKSFSFSSCGTMEGVENDNKKPLWLQMVEDDGTSKCLDFDPEILSTFIKEKVVIYFTSLRGVRKTYEDCHSVKVILRGLRLKLDERDVSMDCGFKEELKMLLGENISGLPKVFIGKEFIGGADEIRRLHEDGKLEKFVENCEKIDDTEFLNCMACGDVRFLPCETCSGSCKVFHEEDESDGFQRCPDCNENGLVRCTLCCE